MAEPPLRPPAWTTRRDPGRPFDPPGARHRLLTTEPVSRVSLWNGRQAWLVARHADQIALLRDRRISADDTRPGYPSVSAAAHATHAHNRAFITMDPPEHTRHRRKFLREFTVRRVRALRPGIERIIAELLDALVAKGPPADLLDAFAVPLPTRVICRLLGVPYEDHAFFLRANAVVVNTRSTPDEALDASRQLTAYLGELVGRKLDRPGDDLLSRLAADQLRTGLSTREECARDARLLLAAGQETTTSMIAVGTCALLQHPEQLAAVRDGGPAQVADAVEELLRHLSVTHSGRRRVAVGDIGIGGRVIRAGEGVICANDLANRDPAAFPDPDRLDVARRARPHLTFGSGPHQCLGQNLARAELRLALPALLRRLPGLRLGVPLEEVPFHSERFVYGVYALPVTW